MEEGKNVEQIYIRKSRKWILFTGYAIAQSVCTKRNKVKIRCEPTKLVELKMDEEGFSRVIDTHNNSNVYFIVYINAVCNENGETMEDRK